MPSCPTLKLLQKMVQMCCHFSLINGVLSATFAMLFPKICQLQSLVLLHIHFCLLILYIIYRYIIIYFYDLVIYCHSWYFFHLLLLVICFLLLTNFFPIGPCCSLIFFFLSGFLNQITAVSYLPKINSIKESTAGMR